MKSIKEIEKYADELIARSEYSLPAESRYYYCGGIMAILAFIEKEENSDASSN